MAAAYTYLEFEKAARRYGKVGGFAHLATLVKRLRASRPGALLLDGGDTWQGSASQTNVAEYVNQGSGAATVLIVIDSISGSGTFNLTTAIGAP